VEITPNRKFKGVVDWDFKNPMSSKVEVEGEGTNPSLGEYAISRKGEWHFTDPTYILNWSGKTSFASGPLAVMSPMDTHVHINFNKNQKTAGVVLSVVSVRAVDLFSDRTTKIAREPPSSVLSTTASVMASLRAS